MTDPVSAGGTVGGGMLQSASNTPKMPETPLETSGPFCAACVTLGGCAKIFSGSSDAPTFGPLCGQLELEWPADLHFKQAFLEPGQEQITGSSSRILKVTGASSLLSLGRRRSKSHRLVTQDLPRNLCGVRPIMVPNFSQYKVKR